MKEYTEKHARSGLNEKLPAIEVFDNHYRKYEVTIEVPEFTSICPRSGLPDFGKIIIHYMPKKSCLELKSLKMYLLAYRNLGIFNENAVNRILDDMVAACKPEWAVVTGDFMPRGGISTTISARYPRR
ncbi:MAG TPA: preQ(1) synthase [Candidatus Omnitrophota bacterium]|nr:preQ(1) synthase [Candidatus Omnitrophota bacterium]